MSATDRRRRRARLRFAIAAGALLASSGALLGPSSAAGYCVSVYPQTNYGVTVCIPWGG